MPEWIIPILSIIGTILASSGFWAFMQSQQTKNKEESELEHAKTELLVGLAHDRILYLGESYIERGWITVQEYENLHDYLYKPYAACGGNGTAKVVIDKVKQLPIK